MYELFVLLDLSQLSSVFDYDTDSLVVVSNSRQMTGVCCQNRIWLRPITSKMRGCYLWYISFAHSNQATHTDVSTVHVACDILNSLISIHSQQKVYIPPMTCIHELLAVYSTRACIISSLVIVLIMTHAISWRYKPQASWDMHPEACIPTLNNYSPTLILHYPAPCYSKSVRNL